MSFDYAPYTELINNLPTKIWLGNEQVDGVGGAHFDVEDPSHRQGFSTGFECGFFAVDEGFGSCRRRAGHVG